MKSNSVLAGMVAGMVSLLGGVASALPVTFPRDALAVEKTRAKRRELTAKWRLHQPLPVRWDSSGPRPAETYRAARRNAHRRPKAA